MTVRGRSITVPWLSFVVVALVSPTLLSESLPAKGRAHAWVRAHAAGLPQSFEKFAQFPVPYQHAIFEALPPEGKAQIMAGRLRVALESERTLTAEQRAFLQRALAQATPATFGGDLKSREMLNKLCAESADMLPGKLRALLQPGVTPVSLGLSTDPSAFRVRVGEFVKEMVLLHAATCECSAGSYCSGCCNLGYGPGWELCSGTESGCGCFFMYPCDGLNC